MNEEKVTVFCYVDNLIDNTDGVFDSLECAWLTVPKEWAEKMVRKQEYDSLEEFFDEYTYDNTDGWIQAAIDEGVLLGTGTGVVE